MKSLLSVFLVMIFAVTFFNCGNLSDNPVSTTEKTMTDNTQPIFSLGMSVVQNSGYVSYILYDGGIAFSYPMYGCSPDDQFYSLKGQSTFEVTCSYSWENCTATYIAGDFVIFNNAENFYWHQYIFCNGNPSGLVTQTITNAGLQPGKTYYARLCNGYFDDNGDFITQ